ncbi:MAG: STAS domain-containing protein [Gammaproteobacteria bacterium]
MAAFTIMSSADGKTVTLSAMGHFDMSLGFALWQYCEPDRNHHESYIIDLADVTDMRDSGLGWIVMLRQWARRSGARVRVIHARPAIACQLLAAGLAHEPKISHNPGCAQGATSP